jgi:hypothetical protein
LGDGGVKKKTLEPKKREEGAKKTEEGAKKEGLHKLSTTRQIARLKCANDFTRTNP